MNIQGSINQLLTLATLAARTSPTLQKRVKIRDLEKTAEGIEGLKDKAQALQRDYNDLYNIRGELFHLDPTDERWEQWDISSTHATNTPWQEEIEQEQEKQWEKQEASKKFREDFTKDLGFNPIQKGMPKSAMATEKAKYSLYQEQEEKRAGRHILYDKHITGGSL